MNEKFLKTKSNGFKVSQHFTSTNPFSCRLYFLNCNGIRNDGFKYFVFSQHSSIYKQFLSFGGSCTNLKEAIVLTPLGLQI